MAEDEEALEEAVPEPPAEAPHAGPWRFKDVESLWDALERYHFYHESAKIPSMGGTGARRGAGAGIQITGQWAAFMVTNRAIDRAMVRLAVVNPKEHLLLHHYYRRGLCEQASGWIEAAAKAGLVLAIRDHCSKKAFDWTLEQAVVTLFALHRAPRRGW